MKDLVASPEPLPAGRYARRGFMPRVSFEVEDGRWRAVQVLDGFFDVQQGVGTPDVIAVQVARPVAIYGTQSTEVPLSEAAVAPAILRGNAGLSVVAAGEVNLAGRPGWGVTVDHGGRTDGFAPVIRVPPGPISILPGRRLWMGFVDAPEGVLAILIGGSIARWREAIAAARPVLDSLRVGD